jgi:sugar phosphate isomerase/epimerase
VNQFKFLGFDGTEITPQEWLPMWAELFPSKYEGSICRENGVPICLERVRRDGNLGPVESLRQVRPRRQC